MSSFIRVVLRQRGASPLCFPINTFILASLFISKGGEKKKRRSAFCGFADAIEGVVTLGNG